MKLTKIFLGFFTVFLTTADDALWLLPFLTSPALTFHQKLSYSLLFCLGLQFIVFASFGISFYGKRLIHDSGGLISLDPGATLSVVAASLAWLVVVFLVLRKWLKKRKRAGAGYQTVEEGEDEKKDESAEPIPFSPWVVFVLAIIGAIDELLYFPALLVGETFDVLDLSIGAFLATGLVLGIIFFWLERCRTMLRALDRIPLWGVVGIYAVSLTIGAVRDVMREPGDGDDDM